MVQNEIANCTMLPTGEYLINQSITRHAGNTFIIVEERYASHTGVSDIATDMLVIKSNHIGPEENQSSLAMILRRDH